MGEAVTVMLTHKGRPNFERGSAAKVHLGPISCLGRGCSVDLRVLRADSGRPLCATADLGPGHPNPTLTGEAVG